MFFSANTRRTGHVKVFFDGGCRPNPGEMETAVVARGKLYHEPQLGHGSSGHAEWLALLHALRVARMLGETDIEVVGDSASVISQANGVTKSKSAEHRGCLAEFQDEACHFARLRVRHISRTKNLAGIALARMRNGAGSRW